MPRSPLEDLARDCVPGLGPLEIYPLGAGLVNESYRVVRDGREFSLRVAANESGELGVDRRWECRVLEAAVAADLAPTIERCDPERGVLVAAWMPGRSLSPTEIRQPEGIDTMADLLRRVHALPIADPARVMSPAAWIAHYRGALQRRGAVAPRAEAMLPDAHKRLALLAESPYAPVVCHSDLHRLNVLIGVRAILLDWEYAHVSDPLWDLAGWAANNDWGIQAAARLLASYLGRAPDRAEHVLLQSFIWLYDYVCLWWSELYLRQEPCAGSAAVMHRVETLGRRLMRRR